MHYKKIPKLIPAVLGCTNLHVHFFNAINNLTLLNWSLAEQLFSVTKTFEIKTKDKMQCGKYFHYHFPKNSSSSQFIIAIWNFIEVQNMILHQLVLLDFEFVLYDREIKEGKMVMWVPWFESALFFRFSARAGGRWMGWRQRLSVLHLKHRGGDHSVMARRPGNVSTIRRRSRLRPHRWRECFHHWTCMYCCNVLSI